MVNIDKLDLQFVKNQVLTAEQMNIISTKIDEIINALNNSGVNESDVEERYNAIVRFLSTSRSVPSSGGNKDFIDENSVNLIQWLYQIELQQYVDNTKIGSRILSESEYSSKLGSNNKLSRTMKIECLIPNFLVFNQYDFQESYNYDYDDNLLGKDIQYESQTGRSNNIIFDHVPTLWDVYTSNITFTDRYGLQRTYKDLLSDINDNMWSHNPLDYEANYNIYDTRPKNLYNVYFCLEDMIKITGKMSFDANGNHYESSDVLYLPLEVARDGILSDYFGKIVNTTWEEFMNDPQACLNNPNKFKLLGKRYKADSPNDIWLLKYERRIYDAQTSTWSEHRPDSAKVFSKTQLNAGDIFIVLHKANYPGQFDIYSPKIRDWHSTSLIREYCEDNNIPNWATSVPITDQKTLDFIGYTREEYDKHVGPGYLAIPRIANLHKDDNGNNLPERYLHYEQCTKAFDGSYYVRYGGNDYGWTAFLAIEIVDEFNTDSGTMNIGYPRVWDTWSTW